MSFRLKLQLAMLVVVIGVTGATLAVLQQSVEATYGRMVQERFASDVSFFSALRAARLALARSKCLDVASSVRLVAAIGADDPALLYDRARDELRNLLQPRAENPDPPPASFFRLIGADGSVIAPTDEVAGLLEGPHPSRWEEQLARAARALAANETQQLGYLAPEIGGRPALQEVIVTPIVDPATGRRLAALAVGFPVEDFGERGADVARQIRGGMWLDGRLYSRGIPESLRPALAATVVEEIAGARELTIGVDGVPHRVFQRALHAESGFPPAYQVGLYSLAEPLTRQRELRRKVLGFGAIALLLALVLSLFLAQSLSVPIRELVTAAGEVGRGNLAVAVPVRSADEVGRLARSFNAMVDGLALKERYRSVLDLVTDKEVARELIDGHVSLGGELREASVLFCDIRGFSALTEKMAPSEVIELLNEHMSALTAVVHADGGVIDKFVGDSLVALFGVPRTTGNDPYHAVRAARAMIVERTRLNESSRHKLEVGIGIASGTVVAGCMGAADRMNYTVLGARVNLAARLCAQAGGMEVLIDDETRRHLGAEVRLEAVAPLHLKGFSEPVAAHRVTDVRPLAAVS